MGIMFPLYLLSKNNEMLLISSEHKCEMCSVSDSYPSCDNIRETSDRTTNGKVPTSSACIHTCMVSYSYRDLKALLKR